MAEPDFRNEPYVVYIPTSERNSPTPASWITKAPGVCGGEARIRRTRIPVWALVEWRRLGLTDAALLANYPSLTPADLAAAWEYHERNVAEIDDVIARQELAMRVGPALFDNEP